MAEQPGVRITEAGRIRLAGLADAILPASGTMPAASQVGIAEDLLDGVLHTCPDLAESLAETLDSDDASAPTDRLLWLQERRPDPFSRLMLVVLAAYYMSSEVRRTIGYEGQQALGIDMYELPQYLEDGSLQRVVDRGRFYRAID